MSKRLLSYWKPSQQHSDKTSRYPYTFSINDVISSSQKLYCALGSGLKLELGLAKIHFQSNVFSLKRSGGGATRPLPTDGEVEELRGVPTVGPRPKVWTRDQKWKWWCRRWRAREARMRDS